MMTRVEIDALGRFVRSVPERQGTGNPVASVDYGYSKMMAVRRVSDDRHAMLARAREARQDKPRKIRKGR